MSDNLVHDLTVAKQHLLGMLVTVQLAAGLGPRGDVHVLLEPEVQARRVFWKRRRDLSDQLKRWRSKRLARLVARLTALHRALLDNSQTLELRLAQGLSDIARFAAQRV